MKIKLIALSFVPFIGMLGFLPWVNKVEPFVLGMPFLFFWFVLWVALTSGVLAILYKFDPATREGDPK
ncbi:DUF3311 domain-containing protein [Brevibacillus choshinensis]|uniref:DUF3311 domain-containing protein n=1 Tax=Brevibacillus choshinensis TaxID=54911 RepID=A0ABX7FWZ4_BRECH|nr:DUF3311 domain-containing protein [Brevibacillus choshinensis]QRG70315.1 DUF3311 domain-containing protein [Brevibacillus choshinensis]